MISLTRRASQQVVRNQISVEHKLQDGFQTLSTKLETCRLDLQSANDQQLSAIERHKTSTASLQRNVIANRRINQKEHTVTRRLISDGNSKVIKAISTKFEAFSRTNFSHTPGNSGSGREITFIGNAKEDVLTPLLLIKEQFRHFILDTVSQQSKHDSSRHLYWLQAEFDNLIMSVIQQVAADARRSSSGNSDRWISSSTPSSGFGKEEKHHKSSQIPDSETVTKTQLTSGKILAPSLRRRTNKGSIWRNHTFKCAIGELHIKLPASDQAREDQVIVDQVEFSFKPWSNICRTAATARFVRNFRAGEYRVHTQLNAFRVVESCEKHYDLYWSGSLAEIDAAFRSGVVSPYDVDTYGNVLCHEVSPRSAEV